MDQPTQIQLAMSALQDATRLAIALRLADGQVNPSLMNRLIHKIPAKDNNDWGKYFNVYQHFKILEKRGVIRRIPRFVNADGKESKAQDYELTAVGKEALERKGFRKKTYEQMI